MDNGLLHEFREKINKDYMVLHIFRNKNDKNKWSVLCSAMDWIEVSLEGIEPSLLSRGNDNKSSIKMITFVSCIDILWESIQQIHRVLFDTTEIPFKEDNSIFKQNVSDNVFFKTIRACFAAHPVNLQEVFSDDDSHERWFASWSGGTFSRKDFSVILYSNVPEKESRFFDISFSDLMEFAKIDIIISKPEDYFNNGIFEMARFGKNVFIKNNRTPEEQAAYLDFLSEKYSSKYDSITAKVLQLREKILCCDPYKLLMDLRSIAIMGQLNVFSEIDHSYETNVIIHAQEFIQSVFISSELNLENRVDDENEEVFFNEIVADFEEVYKDIQVFYYYWAAYIQKQYAIDDDKLKDIVEAQYMYSVRGNRYQVFELEPIKALLSPHDEVLQELFGVRFEEVIQGLDKLRYALSQGFADAFMEFGREYGCFCEAVDSGRRPEEVLKESEERTSIVEGNVFGNDLIDVKKVTGWDELFINVLSSGLNEYLCSREGDFSEWPIVDLPVMKKPFIEINGVTYAFLYYALFDNIYRIVQKEIFRVKIYRRN